MLTVRGVRVMGNSMDFGRALSHLRYGFKIARRGWNGYVAYEPDREVDGVVIKGHFYLQAGNERWHWSPMDADLMAADGDC